jgi:uncharacterized protein YecE (DUF72 family)
VRILVGTSGWQYRDWRGTVYAEELPQRSWLADLSRRFPTIELNNSFYRLPERSRFERWAEQTPPGFLMAVKASRYITHIRRLRETAEPVATFLERARGLGERLGPVLFQLPPRFPAEPQRLEALLGSIPRDTRTAVEFRDRSWYRDDVFELLDAAGAALVWPDRPGERLRLPLTGGWAYVRFHQGGRDAPGYRRDKLGRWAERLASLPAREIFAYFNNDPGGAAVRDAETLMRLLEELDAPVAQ